MLSSMEYFGSSLGCLLIIKSVGRIVKREGERLSVTNRLIVETRVSFWQDEQTFETRLGYLTLTRASR